jgi:perosamine synthetase
MNKIPLFRSFLEISDYNAIQKSLKTGWLTHGDSNLLFEKKFSSLIKVKHSISMNSCTSALECSLKILKKKGQVIIPSWTWVSTANAVINTGNIPVFADVDINSRNLNADKIKQKITKKTIAVIVVHYAGLPCEMDKIVKLCNKKKIKLIEDSAETLGATWKKKFTGSFGTGCFSFFPTKNITTTEGGMLTTNNKNEYLEIKKLIAHGINKSKKKFFWYRVADLPGHNYRLPNHLAALGISQLSKLKKFNLMRRKLARKYDKFFQKYPAMFNVQKVNKNLTHSYQMYTVLVKERKRNKLLYHLKKKNIEASAHFVPPLHRQKYLKKYKTALPNTDILSKTIITLPMYPNLKKKELNKIFKSIENWYKKNK